MVEQRICLLVILVLVLCNYFVDCNKKKPPHQHPTSCAHDLTKAEKNNLAQFVGLSQIGYGYDITTGAQSHLPVIDFHGLKHCAYWNDANNRYEIIPAALVIENSPQLDSSTNFVGLSSKQNFFYSATKSKTNGMNITAGDVAAVALPEADVAAKDKPGKDDPTVLGGKLSKVTGASSILFEHSNRIYGYSYIKQRQYKVTYGNTSKVLGSDIVNALNALPKKNYNQTAYFNWISNFGTHWVRDYVFGGVALMEAEYLMFADSYLSESQKEKQSSVSFFGFFNHMKSSNNIEANGAHASQWMTNTHFVVTGGTPGSKWTETINTNPAIIERGLAAWSELIASDKRIHNRTKIAAFMDKAVDNYVQTQNQVDLTPPKLFTDDRYPIIAILHDGTTKPHSRIRNILDNEPDLGKNEAFGTVTKTIECKRGPGYTGYQNLHKKEPVMRFYYGTGFNGGSIMCFAGQPALVPVNKNIQSVKLDSATIDEMQNHSVDMFTRTDFTKVGIVVTLYDGDKYNGLRLQFYTSVSDFQDTFWQFDAKASSAKIHFGNWGPDGNPGYHEAKAYTGTNYSVRERTLTDQCSSQRYAHDAVCSIPASYFKDNGIYNAIRSMYVY